MKFNWRAVASKQGPKGDGSLAHRRSVGLPEAVRRVALLALLLALAASRTGFAATVPAGTEEVPPDLQDLIEAEISPHLVLPQTALWEFQFMAPYAGGGSVVCGRVNYQSAMRKYVGPQRFYATVKAGRITFAQLQDPPFVDTTGAEAERFDVLCDRK